MSRRLLNNSRQASFIAMTALLVGLISIASLEISGRVYHYLRGDTDNLSSLEFYQSHSLVSRLNWANEIQSHPYFGYLNKSVGTKIEDLKKIDSRDQFTILLTGGSVAEMFGKARGETLVRNLKAQIPELANKTVVFLNTALGGYKQPQQYFVLSYLLGHIDLVLNIDGFNEVDSFTGRDRLPIEFPTFSAKFFAPASGNIFYEFLAIGARSFVNWLNTLARSYSWVSQSQFYFYFYKATTPHLYTLYVFAQKKFVESIYANETRTHDPNSEEAIREYADAWLKYLRLSHVLAREYKVGIFSFVQPNQYRKNSKSLTSQETQMAIDETVKDETFKRMEILSSAVSEAEKMGIVLYDLENLFQTEARTVYIDTCCHINELGNQILEDKIVQTLVKDWHRSNITKKF